ncbi:M20/M25/M40 family metallo-hydrolase [Sandarakinorhabdus oryzae]|uniref:M20/M25/M40 family metallo-hydrolase n=1 Tax=Sandarakinorhabdus oryzae TaxID=2675220 RepID=UPI0012E0DCF2|nr:M20/M25/M40 family metallo-hydrolase [Sandarakinorhabdus oryzae]
MRALFLAATLLTATAASAQYASKQPGEPAFRALYKEMVETDTSVTTGSCTALADKLAVRFKAAGFSDADITQFSVPEFPKEGGIVVHLKGSDPKAKPMLLLGHLDVVAAKPEDWTRSPFKLIEENGYFYGRGTFDDKAQAAIWADLLIRIKQAGKAPQRTLKLALTCGEETTYAFNGADWLARNRPDLISAEFGLNEGGGGRYGDDGKVQGLAVQVGEKTVQNFWVEATNPGGHSSVPRPDNAITDLARAVVAINTYDFPVQFNDTTRAYFTGLSKALPAPIGPAITRLLANPQDAEANAIISQDPTNHSVLRTTCVATLLEAGHAENALAQRARANVNCRMFPGTDPNAVKAVFERLIANPKVTVTLKPPVRSVAASPPMTPSIIGPMQTIAARHFPGAPFLPMMSTGATDAIYIMPIGIPIYGAPGTLIDPDGNGIHGLNERIKVESLMKGRDYLSDLVVALANPK